jgi:hypothetical protein
VNQPRQSSYKIMPFFGKRPAAKPTKYGADSPFPAWEREYVAGLAGSPYGDNSTLYENTKNLILAASLPTFKSFANGVGLKLHERCDALGITIPHDAVIFEMVRAAAGIYDWEKLGELPPAPLPNGSSPLVGQMRDWLLRKQMKIAHPGRTLEVLSDCLVASFIAVTEHLPQLARDGACDEEAPSIPLHDLIPNIGEVIEECLQPFIEGNEFDLFRGLRERLEKNISAISQRSRGRSITPSTHDVPARQLVRDVLAGTGLDQVFYTSVPFSIPIEDRGEHTAIIAGSGWGKTQLLQSIIASDLEYDDPPAIVVIDSTGAMVQRIQRLAIFNDRLKDRLIIIDPVHDVPALNMFDISASYARTTSAIQREAIESEVINLFNYVFSSLDNPLTAQQATPFAFIVRLLLSMPGSNLDTLHALLEDAPKEGYSGALSRFKEAIEKLDPTTQNYFKTQFYARGSDARREQIIQRVYAVTKVPAFQRMFSSINKIDFFTELNRGAIILVNTSENLLKQSSATFGRYIIARCMGAAFERESILPERRRQAFLVVDEAAPYFAEQFEKLLTRVRQFKLGVCIAFQHLEQATPKLKAAIASSTAVKYAGGVGASDARWLAGEMRCDPDFILAQKRDGRPPKWSQFACHVRNFTDRAISLKVPFFAIEKMPTMNEVEHRQLVERNTERVSADMGSRELPKKLDTVSEIPPEPTPDDPPLPTVQAAPRPSEPPPVPKPRAPEPAPAVPLDLAKSRGVAVRPPVIIDAEFTEAKRDVRKPKGDPWA